MKPGKENNIPSFQQFWNAYALKRDRIAAERAWNKLRTSDRLKAYEGIAAYKRDCERRGISRMYAQGYLNHRRWEDDFNEDEEKETTPTLPENEEHEDKGMSEW
ncbi:MAG: hypothetical protein ACOCNX_01025 [Prevotella sp.]